jgi:transposase-like protein
MATESAPKTLREAILFFADYAKCKQAVEAIRWPDGVICCPHCGSENVTYLESARVWKCYEKHPRAKFSLKVGTIFEDSAIGLEKWLPALWLLTNCKNGISSYELARALGVTQKTAWFMLSRLRLALQPEHGGRIDGDVEVDETYIGGKTRNMSIAKRKRIGITQGRSMAGKVAVMGLLDRHGKDGLSQVACKSSRVASGITSVPSSTSTSSQVRPSTPIRISRIRDSVTPAPITSSTTLKRTSMAPFTPTAAKTSGRS